MEERVLALLKRAGVQRESPRLRENLSRFLRVLEAVPDLLDQATLAPLLDRVALDMARGSDSALVRLELLAGVPPVPPSTESPQLAKILAQL